jgi:uncharacterized protein
MKMMQISILNRFYEWGKKIMIFLDTSFYIALVNSKDVFSNRALELFKEIKTGKYGTTYTSIYVMAESAILTAIRTKNNKDAILAIQSFFMGENKIATLIRSTEELEIRTWELFKKVNISPLEQPMSLTDCTNVIFAQHYHIGTIIAFDAHFEGWLHQLK